MRSQTRLSVLLCGSLLAGCSSPGGSPASPDPPPSGASALALGAASGLDSGALAAIVVSALEGTPLSGIEVEMEGAGVRRTGDDGIFEVPASSTGAVALELRGGGVVTRRTHLRTDGDDRAVVDLLPSEGPFDLDFFDHVFRDQGELHTRRWTLEPRFEIWTKAVECRDGELGECTDLHVLEDDAPGQFVALAREVVLADARKFTGGFVEGSRIETVTPASGTTVPWREYLKAGTVVIVFTRGYETSFARTWPWASGRMYSAALHIAPFHKAIPFVYSHELAHALGFRHPIGMANVPLRSVMRSYQDRPTPADELHGRILYRRPPGSRSPDVDPSDYSVNASRTEAGAPDLSTLEQTP